MSLVDANNQRQSRVFKSNIDQSEGDVHFRVCARSVLGPSKIMSRLELLNVYSSLAVLVYRKHLTNVNTVGLEQKLHQRILTYCLPCFSIFFWLSVLQNPFIFISFPVGGAIDRNVDFMDN